MTNIQAAKALFFQQAAQSHLDRYFNNKEDLFGKKANTRESLTSIVQKKFTALFSCPWEAEHEKCLFKFYRRYAFRRIHAEKGFTRQRVLASITVNRGTSREKKIEVVKEIRVTPLTDKALTKHLEATLHWMEVAILLDFSTENIFTSSGSSDSEPDILPQGLESPESDEEGDPILQQASPKILAWANSSFKLLLKERRLTPCLEFMSRPSNWKATTKRKTPPSPHETSSSQTISSQKHEKKQRIQIAPEILKKTVKIARARKLSLNAPTILALEAHFTQMKVNIFYSLKVSWGLYPPGIERVHNPERVISRANMAILSPLSVSTREISLEFTINQLSSLHDSVLFCLYYKGSVNNQKIINYIERKIVQLSRSELDNIRPVTDMYLLLLLAAYHRETYEHYLHLKRNDLTTRSLLPRALMFC